METPFTAKTERKVGLGESSSHRERAIESEAPVKRGWTWYWADVEARSLDVTFRSESLPNSQASQRPHDPTIVLTLRLRRWGWSSGSGVHNLTLKSGEPNLEKVAGYCHGCQEEGGLVEKTHIDLPTEEWSLRASSRLTQYETHIHIEKHYLVEARSI